MIETTRKVQVLPDNLANKIAAGEVIQRPESVVKELLENSLDAGATHITIVIKDGGKTLIQVIDDGRGMDEADAVSSFLRHATSKISSYEDLEAIMTYGFRGEALPSIASVAQVTMRTRTDADEAAVVVEINGGDSPRVGREGREPGTSVTVRNLFFNVPARQKFLKSMTTEFRHIYEVVQRVAVSHPEIAIHFVSDNATILDLKAGELQDRMLDIFGDRQCAGMIWAEEKAAHLSVAGYLGKPEFGQKTRASQYLFLNGRYIVNRNINHAVYSAYEHLMIKGTYPFFLLFIECDPRRVDVNVHPAKLEAKFDDEQSIYRLVSALVRNALASTDYVPAASLSDEEGGGIRLRFTGRQHTWPDAERRSSLGFVDTATGEIVTPRQTGLRFDEDTPGRIGGDEIAQRLFQQSTQDYIGTEREEDASLPSRTERSEVGSGALIWQLHNKYILSQIRSGLMIVDQHVAHERILYERALGRFARNAPASQQLLFPQTVQLSPGDHALLTELLPYFELLGFALKPFGKNTIVVEGVPPDVKQGAETRIVQDLLGLYKEYQQHGHMDARDNIAKSFSCKAAVKAGDKLSEEEMRSLVDQLFATKMPYVCPHGRPIVLKISIEELDRRFGRT